MRGERPEQAATSQTDRPVPTSENGAMSVDARYAKTGEKTQYPPMNAPARTPCAVWFTPMLPPMPICGVTSGLKEQFPSVKLLPVQLCHMQERCDSQSIAVGLSGQLTQYCGSDPMTSPLKQRGPCSMRIRARG